MKSQDTVLLGMIGAPHGVRGWVRVNSYTASPEDVFAYKSWMLDARSSVSLANWQKHGRRWIAKLVGVDTPEQAGALTGLGVYVEADALPKLAEGDFYWSQLVGAQVTTLDHKVLGDVESMIETASNDVMVVKPSKGSLDQRERLIPYIEGQVVRSMERKTAENTGSVAQVWVDWDADF